MSKPAMKPGFFTMDTVTAVCATKDLVQAREIAMERVAAMHGYATPENIQKATVMIERAKTVTNLGLAITNFMFAHPSEGLKTIR